MARALLSELQLREDNWPQLVPLFESAINNTPSPLRNNIAPITSFTGRPRSPPISTFLRSYDSTPVKLTDAQREIGLKIDSIISYMEMVHPIVRNSSNAERNRMRTWKSIG